MAVAPDPMQVPAAPGTSVRLDTAEYTSLVGESYVFRAEAGGGTVPEPFSSDPSKAGVAYAGPAGNDGYLYRVTALAPGTASVGIRAEGMAYSFPFRAVESALIPVPPLLQNPELPTGCEVTALTNVLNFYGYPVSKTYLADFVLPKDDSVSVRNGRTYRADPFRAFVGDPRGNGSYGCYAPVIARTARTYLASVESGRTARDLSGSEPAALYHSIAEGTPVLVWATMDMGGPTYRSSWYDRDTGEKIQWIGGEHCVVLIGCSASTVTVSDPLRGIVSYGRSLFETRYRQVLRQAVVIE